MKIGGKHYYTIWRKADDPEIIQIIDQRFLPHRFLVEDMKSSDDAVVAIKDMLVRGAPLIGATAAYGMYLAALEARKAAKPEAHILAAAQRLKDSRPTAINLAWAVEEQLRVIAGKSKLAEIIEELAGNAEKICADEIVRSRSIGEFGAEIFRALWEKKGRKTLNVLTHCNAGWLACVDYGTATAPMYVGAEQGIDLHVWVDETRPRNQGASLTAWELLENGIKHSVIADNVGGHLMQHGMVDVVIVGADRVTRTGDAANKIGTYLKALAAADNDVPFYVALPSSTFDWSLRDGVKEIPIEERDNGEVKYIQGLCEGDLKKVLITPQGSPARNFAFDVTPHRLITGLITERGTCPADEVAISKMFPEQANG